VRGGGFLCARAPSLPRGFGARGVALPFLPFLRGSAAGEGGLLGGGGG